MTTDIEITQHGVMVHVANHGLLLTGPAGIGKSSLALSLINDGHQLIADDLVTLHRKNNQLIGSCIEQTYGLLHHRELGLMDMIKLYGQDTVRRQHPLDLIIEMTNNVTDNTQKLTASQTTTELLGVQIPTIQLSTETPCPLTIRIYSWIKNRQIQPSTIASFTQKQQQMMQQ